MAGWIIFTAILAGCEKPQSTPGLMSITKVTSNEVMLEWQQSNSPNVTGQYVYVSTGAPNPERLFDVSSKTWIPNVSHYAAPLESSGTFYFALTAVDESGFESNYSNVVSVSIDADPSPAPSTTPSPTPIDSGAGVLVNISTRAFVQVDGNVLIAGFVIRERPIKVLIRAIGPSLSVFFPVVLNDPLLELRSSTGGLIDENDNWRDDQEEEILATGIQPVTDKESAILRTLPVGNYTAIVRGVNHGTGVALVEVYALP